jgi:hypothetical protein
LTLGCALKTADTHRSIHGSNNNGESENGQW